METYARERKTNLDSFVDGVLTRLPQTQEWPELARQCEALSITSHDLQLEQSSIDEALAAIKAARKGAAWEHKQRQKLRKRVVRAIEDAEAARAARRLWIASRACCSAPPLRGINSCS